MARRSPATLVCSSTVELDEALVDDHVRIQDRDLLSPIPSIALG